MPRKAAPPVRVAPGKATPPASAVPRKAAPSARGGSGASPRASRAKAPAPIELGATLWMTVGGANLGGPGRVGLLRAIAEQGSITQAAKAFGMSYKAAWDAIDTMNNVAGEPLVERVAGGRGGGSTRLTPRGLQLVERFDRLQAVHRRFVQVLSDESLDLARDFDLLRTMNMRTSARNQLLGSVAAVRTGAVNDEVELALPGGARLVAVITHESGQALGLVPGAAAFALVKASSVLIATDLGGARVSARNQLAGTVERVVPGAVNCEVVVALDGGGTLAAVVTQSSANEMALAPGLRATALFKASSVILGVPA